MYDTMNQEVVKMSNEKGNASTRAKNKWQAANYDSLRIVVPKGRKADLQDHAAVSGESLNGFVNRAIYETIERDREKDGDT
jgi:hypothetical protein